MLGGNKLIRGAILPTPRLLLFGLAPGVLARSRHEHRGRRGILLPLLRRPVLLRLSFFEPAGGHEDDGYDLEGSDESEHPVVPVVRANKWNKNGSRTKTAEIDGS